MKAKIIKLLILTIVYFDFSAFADTKNYRASFRDDPSTTIVIAWSDDGTSTNARLHFGTQDFGQNHLQYPNQATISRTQIHKGQTSRFVRLTGLQPATTYYFVIKDDQSVSPRMSFRTLSDNPNVPIFFISGGDTRTGVPLFEFETEECIPRRRRGNELVAKIRPDFVAFTGDFTLSGTSHGLWDDWFSDWQLTIGPEGRLIPIVPVLGNHEGSHDLFNFFDIPNSNSFYALTIGGKLLRLYTLSSDLGCDQIQVNWLTNDLQLHTNTAAEPYWKAIQYHVPLVPHGFYSPAASLISCWAPLFAQYKISLAMESHSHVQKVTWPIVPSTGAGSDHGFIRDDINGTVFIGEGCWGAPLRNLYTYHSPDAAFNWTRNQGKFAGYQLVTVTKQKMQIRTVKFHTASDAANVSQVQPNDPIGTLPTGLTFWNPSNGSVVEILSDKIFSNNANLASLITSQGTLTPAFSPSITAYTVDLPGTTTIVPTVMATAAHPGAHVSVSQAVSLTGTLSQRTAAVLVTAEDGSTLKTYTVVFNLLPISDANLSSLNTSIGTLQPTFQPTVFNYSVVLPFGTVDTPFVSATPNDPLATMSITQPTAPDGIAYVEVVSSDGLLTNTYTVNYSIASSTDNFILSFFVQGQIGTSVIDNVNNAIVITMPFNFNVNALIPNIVFSGISIHPQSGQAQNFTQPVLYTVLSADNTPRVYEVSVNFASASDDAYLIYLDVENYLLSPVFDTYNHLYFCEIPSSEISIEAIPRDPAASVKVFLPENLSGNAAQRTANILVIAPDFSTTKVYSIVFGSITSISHASWIDGLKVYPNPAIDYFYINGILSDEPHSIYVYSGLGHEVYSATISNSSSLKIDTSAWASGTYFVLLKSKNGVISKARVLINK